MVVRIAAARDPTTLLKWRLIWLAIIVVVAALSVHPTTNAILQSFWAWFSQLYLVKHDNFEPLEATFAFGFWINVWRLVDLFCPNAHKWKLYGPPKQEREFKNQSKLGYLFKPGVSNIAALAYLAPLMLRNYLNPRRVLPIEAPSPLQLLGGVASSLCAYDLLFFFVHLAMHKIPFVYRHVHAVHHTQKNLSSHEVIHHSFIDGSFQVMTNVIVLRTLGLHPLTRALHNVAVTYMLTETHSGYDMPWMLHNVLPHSILGGSPAHEEHHRGGKQHYQQFFLYLDWLVGTIAKDKNNTGSSVNSAEKKTEGKSHMASVPLRPSVLPVI